MPVCLGCRGFIFCVACLWGVCVGVLGGVLVWVPGMMVLLFVFFFFWGLLLMLRNVFDEYPGFEFFSAVDVLRVRSLALPVSVDDWGA